MAKSKEELLNINTKALNGKILNCNATKVYFTYADILKLQKYIQKTYTNFNGGFGMFSDEAHVLLSAIGTDVGFSFVVETEHRDEAARTSYRKELFDDTNEFVWNAYNCTDKFTWLEMIIILCEDKGIAFRYDPNIIDEIIDNNTNTAK